jgi:hypothetical protein
MTKQLLTATIAIVLLVVSAPADAKTHQGQQADRGAEKASTGRGATASRTCLRPEAQALLGRIEAQFGPVRLVSTCRPGARIAGTGKISKHATGEAIDFLAPNGRKAEVVSWLVANHRAGGTMTYRDMGHIHVDIGYRFVALSSPSGGGAIRIASRSTASRSDSSARRVAERRNADSIDTASPSTTSRSDGSARRMAERQNAGSIDFVRFAFKADRL